MGVSKNLGKKEGKGRKIKKTKKNIFTGEKCTYCMSTIPEGVKCQPCCNCDFIQCNKCIKDKNGDMYKESFFELWPKIGKNQKCCIGCAINATKRYFKIMKLVEKEKEKKISRLLVYYNEVKPDREWVWG